MRYNPKPARTLSHCPTYNFETRTYCSLAEGHDDDHRFTERFDDEE